jgi:hypothetical protein
MSKYVEASFSTSFPKLVGADVLDFFGPDPSSEAAISVQQLQALYPVATVPLAPEPFLSSEREVLPLRGQSLIEKPFERSSKRALAARWCRLR